MGVCIEPPEYLLGFQRFEHFVYRTQPEGHPSGPGDLDLTVYGLRKFCVLALKGSPTALLPLFVERRAPARDARPRARSCATLAPAFVARSTGRAFLGYLTNQRRGLTGERHATRTRELSKLHGYDTKYAMHALRIAYQGIELLSTGRITLPVPEPERSELRSVRNGELALDDVLARIDARDRAARGARHGRLDPGQAGSRARWTSSWCGPTGPLGTNVRRMNGAESVLRTLAGAGVDVCFANPGTSEMHFVAAMDRRARDARRADACSRAWPPAPPTATRGWPASPPRRCCTSGPGFGQRRSRTCTTRAGPHADGQPRRRPRDPAPAAGRAADQSTSRRSPAPPPTGCAARATPATAATTGRRGRAAARPRAAASPR